MINTNCIKVRIKCDDNDKYQVIMTKDNHSAAVIAMLKLSVEAMMLCEKQMDISADSRYINIPTLCISKCDIINDPITAIDNLFSFINTLAGSTELIENKEKTPYTYSYSGTAKISNPVDINANYSPLNMLYNYQYPFYNTFPGVNIPQQENKSEITGIYNSVKNIENMLNVFLQNRKMEETKDE